ncbi:MAG: hypothetical protein HYY55_01920 [Candidatus Niyogibacteria bacterium]|nr:MAG: hypothetical protein HYY55_01920 [Candidatus Niyogibacteria bacterium]
MILVVVFMVAVIFFWAVLFVMPGSRKYYLPAFFSVVLLDAIVVKFIFPLFPDINSAVNFLQALLIVLISAVVIGVFLLEILGGYIVGILRNKGLTHNVSRQLTKNFYLALAPFLNAGALMLWTLLFPSLGFVSFWPNALLAGFILHFIDEGIVVPWFFKLTEATDHKRKV